jgi:mRNA interferase MazF
MRRGEVWWVEFDPSIGSEIRKTRPAVIISNDAANRNLKRVVVMPLTSNTGRLYPGEALVQIGEQTSKAMADQVRGKPRRSGRGRIARAATPSLGLMGCLLLLDVLAHDGNRRTAAG